MKQFRSRFFSNSSQQGFSLVESVLSLGIMSFGFLALAPLLTLGLTGAHVARTDRATAQIAATLLEEGKEGLLSTNLVYLDYEGNSCASAAQAAYLAQGTFLSITSQGTPADAGPLTRLTLRVTPVGNPTAARTYAAVYPSP